MTENNSHNLKDMLFGTLSGLIDGSVDVQTAKAISCTAQTILNAAKVEMEFARLCETHPDNWLTSEISAPVNALPKQSRKGITHPKPGVTVHRIT